MTLAPPYKLGGYKTNQLTRTASADLSSTITKNIFFSEVELIVGKNPADTGGVAQVDTVAADNHKKLTKRELLELADFLYSRYQYNKKPLNKGSSKTILETETSHTKTSKGGSPWTS